METSGQECTQASNSCARTPFWVTATAGVGEATIFPARQHHIGYPHIPAGENSPFLPANFALLTCTLPDV
eukprot:647396-Pelagomonas_calceolata.AAC.1